MPTVLRQPGVTYHYDGFGKLHNDIGPAVSIRGEVKEWWYHGHLHRIGGPAIINPSGKQYWLFGKRHRLDGPAIECKTTKQWWINDIMHREDGPAIINGSFEAYYLENKYYTKEDYLLELKKRKKLMNKYFHKWLFHCDQPGKKLFNLLAERNFLEMSKLYN